MRSAHAARLFFFITSIVWWRCRCRIRIRIRSRSRSRFLGLIHTNPFSNENGDTAISHTTLNAENDH